VCVFPLSRPGSYSVVPSRSAPRFIPGARRYVSTSGDANMWPLRLRIKEALGPAPLVARPGKQSRFCFRSRPSVRNPARGPSSNGYPAASRSAPDTWRVRSERAPDILRPRRAGPTLFSAGTGRDQCGRRDNRRKNWIDGVAGERPMGGGKVCAGGGVRGADGDGRNWNRWSDGRACRAARGRRHRRQVCSARGLPPKGSSRWRATLVPLRRPGDVRVGQFAPVGWSAVLRARGTVPPKACSCSTRVVLRLLAGSTW
jgi:hypothetical protein